MLAAVLERAERFTRFLNSWRMNWIRRWSRSILELAARHRSRVIVDGIQLNGAVRQTTYLRSVANRTAEPFMLELFRDAVEGVGDVLDVGSFLGYYALMAAHSVDHHGNVWAFEADPRNYELLVKNVATNHAMVEHRHVAVSDRDGTLRISLTRGEQSTSHVSEAGEIEVRAVRLDSFLPPQVAPRAIKIDVEGHEVSALLGMRELIVRHRPKMFIECNGRRLASQGVTTGQLKSLILSLGYQIQIIDEASRTLIAMEDWAFDHRAPNLLCTSVISSTACR